MHDELITELELIGIDTRKGLLHGFFAELIGMIDDDVGEASSLC